MKTETAELLDYNEAIDPIEGDEETTYTDDDLDTESEDDQHEIQVGNSINEPDAEDADLGPTEANLPDDESTDDDE
ncbi:MAG: hypothetical protein ABIN91_07480 [Mucilaginibacter sp.]|uniref:hypothetical protein n=1 Tax=Mucilaginibacter sp. TaxID=1882438 RepID=UPI003263C8C3